MFTLAQPIQMPPSPSANDRCVQSQLRPKKGAVTVKWARKWRCRCLASDQPRERRTIPKITQDNEDELKKGVDPVGFLNKWDISHKAFAQFLRERSYSRFSFTFYFYCSCNVFSCFPHFWKFWCRHKALKDLKDEIFNRHLHLKEFASGFVSLSCSLQYICMCSMFWLPFLISQIWVNGHT